MSTKSVFFISHAADDHALAALLKRVLEENFPDCEVFVSSDPGALAPRDPWVEKILDNLERSVVVFVLATERVLKRPWVWFEAGARWQRRPEFLTVCIGTVHKGSLPAPFALYQALNLGDPRDLETFFDEAAKLVSRKSAPDYAHLAAELTALEKKVAQAHAIKESPLLDARAKSVQQIMNGLGKEETEALRLFVIYGSGTDYFMLQQLHGLGLAQGYGTICEGVGNKTNFIQLVPGQSDRERRETRRWDLRPEFADLLRTHFGL